MGVDLVGLPSSQLIVLLRSHRQGRDERRMGSNLTEWIDHDTGKLEVQFSNL